MSVVMDKYEVLEEEQSLRYFSFAFGLSQTLGAVSVILVAVWMGSFQEGFAWSEDPAKEFSYHPLFMVIGLLFLYGEAIMVYRVFRHERKKLIKATHIALHSLTAVFFVIALKAVFDSHNLNTNKEGVPTPIPNLYTLHSWVGLSTVLLFCCQYVCGFVVFFFPGLSLPARQWYMPIHRCFGLGIFIMAAAASLMGITERAVWHTKKWDEFSSEGITLNCLGLTIALYVATVVYLVANPRFKRKPLPEQESLQQLHTAD